MLMFFTIPGTPFTKKNHRPIFVNRHSGARFLGKSDTLKNAEESAYWRLVYQYKAHPFPKITTPVNIAFRFYMPTRRKTDLSNLYELPQDALVKAGILADDSLICSHDGSRKFYDRDNPRTEIVISEFVS